jgi:hypothetical protein
MLSESTALCIHCGIYTVTLGSVYMTITTIGYIKFKTHTVHVSRQGSRIYCFKSTDSRCDIEIFTDQESAADYILTPFASIVYEVIWPEE